ncbi:MAG: HvfC/BufC N-terminal domain-containing protein [Geminicoccaceae bacterium]
MPSLFDIQTAFIDALKNPDRPAPEALAKRFGGERPKRRFDVYRNSVAVGMIEALRATFPAVERLVGGDFFSAAARVYLDQDPPRSPLLFRYGKTFGNFIEKFPPAASVPYLGDVARLEWARLEAYHAADHEPLAIDALGSVPENEIGELTFELHPSLALLQSPWPVVSLWAASTDRGSSEDVDMKQPEEVIIIRPSLDVDTRLLPVGGFNFMNALKENAALEQAAQRASEMAEGFDLATHLQGLFEVGAVVAIGKNNHMHEG